MGPEADQHEKPHERIIPPRLPLRRDRLHEKPQLPLHHETLRHVGGRELQVPHLRVLRWRRPVEPAGQTTREGVYPGKGHGDPSGGYQGAV